MMKKIMTIVLSGIMMLSIMIMPIHASSSYQAQLYASVTDAGEVVDRIVIDFHSLKSLKGITKNSFTINAKSIVDFGVDKGNVYYDTNRTIEKVKKMGKKVILYLNQGEGSTLTWLTEQRNYPGKLIYTITLNHDLYSIKKEDVRFVIKKKIINEETSKFRSVKGHYGLNYQFYNANSRRLIVWFHGNGEGDIKGQTHNNVAQMLANRGTVGWATKEAQRTFKGANVMAFQVPDTWYNADSENLLEKAYKEIMFVAKKYRINKIMVSGASAGGYMSTRMIIRYPRLFDTGIIICPAIANQVSNEDILTMKKAKTSIWLVQGETDASVDPEQSSKRMWSLLSEGQRVHQRTDRFGYTTYETANDRLKLTLYKTYDGKIKVYEDYNYDHRQEAVYYNDHWTWIYVMRNHSRSVKGIRIFNWASRYMK